MKLSVFPLLNPASSKHRWLLLLGLGALILAHCMALVFRIQPAVSLWFPPSGVAIVLAIWLGPIGIGMTAIASMIMAPIWGNHGWTQLAGLTDATEPLVVWLIYRRWCKGSPTLNSLKDAVAFTLSAPILASLTSAIVGILILVAVGKMTADTIASSLPHWWLGNALGIMAIAPATLLMLTPVLQQRGWLSASSIQLLPKRLPASFNTRLEVAVILALCVCTAVLSVSQANWGTFAFQQFSFLGFVPILWAATRFGVIGGVLASSYCVLATLTAYLLAYPNAMSLLSFPVQPEVLHVHKLSLLVQCGVALFVGTAMSERSATQAALAAEQVRATEYQARAHLSEQLISLNQSLTGANAQLEALNQEKDTLLQREQAARGLLIESEERFRTSLETMSDGVSILAAVRDAGGQIVDFRFEYVNAAACASNRMAREEHLGENLREIFPAHDETGLFQEYCEVVETGHPLIKEELFYEDVFGQQCLSRAYDIRAAKLDDGFIAVWREITQAKRDEADRAQLLIHEQEVRQQAEAASRMKDEFLAIVSHELRSPLNAILGWSRLLRSRKFDAAKVDQALEVIERNAKAQTQLIEDLLDISRIIRGQVRLYIQPVNLEFVIKSALDTVRPTAEVKGIALQFEPFDRAVRVSGDVDRLQQVVWNLLSNAIKFTPNHGRVEVALSMTSDQAQIKVTDTGIGIRAEFLPHVFERFRQEDSTTTRAYGGLGLGLAIVRNLIELHSGVVGVESLGERQGTTFTVRLPLLQADRAMPEASSVALSMAERDVADAALLGGLRILIVDDEPDTRSYLQAALEQHRAIVVATASVEAALQSFHQARPDVLVSDISMPEQDGYSLIRQIRALPIAQGGQIPAAALTAYAREEDRVRAIEAGFNRHLAKPIDLAELISVVAALAALSSK